MKNHAILLISCLDKKGINAAVTNFIFQNNGNIVHADQHIDEQTNTFFMRIEWSLEGFSLSETEINETFASIAKQFAMHWELHFTSKQLRVAIFVSKHLHCLIDLFYRQQSGHFECEIPLVISNHPEAASVAERFGASFHEFPIAPENKIEQERKQLALLGESGIDLIILARYHQILTEQFVKTYPNQIINIHHSFLPAFAGGNPYLQAYQKGVKIIGATSHYVTSQLDEGPIIEQDTVRVSHRDSLTDLIRKGEDMERMVLSRAVKWHLERKVLCYSNKTVVFD